MAEEARSTYGEHIGIVRGAAMLLGDSPGAITALVTLAAAAFYGAASLGARIAYEPAGVAPREIGLTAGTVLAQSAIGVLAGIALVLLLYVLATRIVSVVRRRRHRVGRFGDVPAQRPPGWIVVSVYFAAVALTCLVLVLASVAARRNIEQGIRPGPVLGLPAIWPAEVATVHWATEGPTANIEARPDCALYLGEANGTRVLYDAPNRRTIRVRSSDVAIEATRSRSRC